MKHSRIAIIRFSTCLFFALIGPLAIAQEEKPGGELRHSSRLRKFAAIDNDPRTLNKDEAYAYLQSFYTPKAAFSKDLFNSLDQDKNGELSHSEFLMLAKTLNNRVELDLEDLLADQEQVIERGISDAIGYLEETRYWRETPTKGLDLGGFRIRESIHEVSFTSKDVALDRAKSALFSFVRDFEENADIWSARGAIMHPFRVDDGRSETAMLVIPGISFDRVSNDRNKSKEVDKLVGFLGSAFEFPGGPFDMNTILATASFATDFDLDSSIMHGEVLWTPMILDAGIGSVRTIAPLSIDYRLRPAIHVEAGIVFDSGGKSRLEDGDGYFRIGPRIGLDLWPKGDGLWNRIHLSADFHYLYGVAGEPSKSMLFEAGLNIRIDDIGHFTLAAKYRNGDVLITNDDIDLFEISLGIKF